jgi:hypothetical protein
MRTHWELDGNIAIKQKKISLWVFGRGEGVLKCLIFLKRYAPTLKFYLFFFLGGIFLIRVRVGLLTP